MRFRSTILVAFMLVVGNTSVSVQNAIGQTRLGLHVTQEELNIWKQRAASGPYKSAGDVSTNSPGDWTRIQSNANSFKAAPEGTWSGQTSASCWTPTGVLPGRSRLEKARDAAFVYLLTGDTTYIDPVRTLLLNQTAVTGTNFADSVRWNTSWSCAIMSPGWEIVQWLTKYLYTYDYIRAGLSQTDRTTIETWLVNAANFFDALTDRYTSGVFPGRLSDNYTPSGEATACNNPRVVYYGSPYNHCSFHYVYENTEGIGPMFFGQVGILTNNTTLQDKAKRWFREWLQYNVFADNATVEFYRWTSSAPSKGFLYAPVMIMEMGTLADAFARNGDTSLYDYSTSSGLACCTPAGGPKSLAAVIAQTMRYVDGNIVRYGTNLSGNNGNPSYQIRSVDGLSGETYIGDTYFAPSNIFSQNNYVKAVYMRTASGAPAYPSSPFNAGYCPQCGVWGTLPGVLFMFGQMEGKVSPYGGTTPPAPPPESSSGPITVDSTYPGYNITPIDDSVVNATGGTATTWASAESTIDPHWITITFSSPRQLNTATIYWVYNNSRQTYMTSQQVDFQYWNGSTFQTAGSFNYTADMPSSTIIFPSVTTSQIRFHQPANKGNPQYTTVLWVTEVDYGASTLQPPAAPSGLLTVSQ